MEEILKFFYHRTSCQIFSDLTFRWRWTVYKNYSHKLIFLILMASWVDRAVSTLCSFIQYFSELNKPPNSFSTLYYTWCASRVENCTVNIIKLISLRCNVFKVRFFEFKCCIMLFVFNLYCVCSLLGLKGSLFINMRSLFSNVVSDFLRSEILYARSQYFFFLIRMHFLCKIAFVWQLWKLAVTPYKMLRFSRF